MKIERETFYLSPENEISAEYAPIPPQPKPIEPLSRLSYAQNTTRSLGQGPQSQDSRQQPPTPSAGTTVKTEGSTLNQDLVDLVELVANVTEAYSAVIFLADPSSRTLAIAAAHTLSRDLILDCRIGFSSGLVGWTAENKTKVSVCPFEHDAKTLLYYRQDQGLKSFIAFPILSRNNDLLGVIACDSKKSYAFPKVTEKILVNCASQVARMIQLYRQLGTAPRKNASSQNEQSQTSAQASPNQLQHALDQLRAAKDEKQLLSIAADLPFDLVDRDALIVMALSEDGPGGATFYSATPANANGQNRMGHRLLEMVCKNKKVLCGDRSVHALPTDDIKQRSFLSVPFHVLGREAGSFNLLSRPHVAFDVAEIGALEKVATVVGRELERHRLLEKVVSSVETTGMLSWKNFSLQAKNVLRDARNQKTSLSVLRISLSNLLAIEDLVGVDVATQVVQKLMRLVDQVKRSNALSCYLHGFQIIILMESSDCAKTVNRLCNLIEKLATTEFGTLQYQLGVKLGQLIIDGIQFAEAQYPRDGDSLNLLVSRTLRLLDVTGSAAEQPKNVDESVRGKVANVGNWA